MQSFETSDYLYLWNNSINVPAGPDSDPVPVLAFCQFRSESGHSHRRQLVQVDAVVTDSANKHISNLKAEDFEVLQDGKPQTITNCSYIASGIAPLVITPSPSNGRNPLPPPQRPLTTAGSVRRMFALVVDDLGLSFESIVHVRDALRKFVNREMQAGDLVAIVRTSAGMGALQRFTADPRILNAAIDHI